MNVRYVHHSWRKWKTEFECWCVCLINIEWKINVCERYNALSIIDNVFLKLPKVRSVHSSTTYSTQWISYGLHWIFMSFQLMTDLLDFWSQTSRGMRWYKGLFHRDVFRFKELTISWSGCRHQSHSLTTNRWRTKTIAYTCRRRTRIVRCVHGSSRASMQWIVLLNFTVGQEILL